MSYKIVVMSCDKNKDLWKPFHLCMEKYWKDHPEIIYSSETLENPYYKTICRDIPINKWTKRVVETIKDLPCKHILLMVDDIFIRDYVDNDLIWSLCQYISGDIASLNFEKSFDNKDIDFVGNILLRNKHGKFKLSLMCQLWQKKVMLQLFNKELDPWTFEKRNNALNYQYLILRNSNVIKWGRENGEWKFGLVRGKWAKECKEFFDKENIEIDYSIRGFCD